MLRQLLALTPANLLHQFGTGRALDNARRDREEVAATGETLRSLGYRSEAITGDGRLDGGDIVKIGDQVYVGRGGRTNAEGVRQLRAALTPEGARVTAVPLTPPRSMPEKFGLRLR